MPIAYIMVNSDTGAEEEVFNELKKIDGVTEVFILYGVYDIAVKIVSEDLYTITEVISDKIRKIENVEQTLSMIVSERRPK